MPTRLKLFSLLAVLPFFAGCATVPEDDPPPVVVFEPVKTFPEFPPNPETEPQPEHTSGPSTTDLMGLEPAEVQAMLGEVSLKRWEGEVQVMQFKNGACILDVYLYESAPGEAYQVAYLSARYLGGAVMDTDACLAALVPNP